MTAHAAIKNTFFEDFFVQKSLTIIKTLNPDSEIVVFSLISKTTIARLHNPSD